MNHPIESSASDEPAPENKADRRNDLALARTDLANERTLLAYGRTALMFAATGLTLVKFFPELPNVMWYSWTLGATAVAVLGVGIFRFYRLRRQLRCHTS